MSLRTPLSRVKGLGSAREGTGHWWQQRVTAVALVPLALWLLASLLGLSGSDHAAVTAWLTRPFNAVLMILFLLALFHHAQLGVQVVIEDYVDSEWQKLASLILVRFIAVFAGLAAILAVLKVFLEL